MPDDLDAFCLDRFYSDLPIYAVHRRHLVRAALRRAGEARHPRGARAGALDRRTWSGGSSKRRLQSLRAQLQPHFLFNALNTISAFTESNPQMARRLMAQLGDLLRASLRHTAQPLVTLGEELTFLDDFLAIESARFEGACRCRSTQTTICCRAWCRAFLLQPLVENAIRHGVGTRLSGGRVDDHRDRHAGRARRVRVRDDGVGLPAEWSFERDAGVGLRNVAARLEHIYGRPGPPEGRSGLPTGGVEVQIDVPGAAAGHRPSQRTRQCDQ